MSLREMRERQNMSRRELADISGVSFRSIQDYEQQHKSLASAKGETLYRFSQVLDCTVEELLEGEPLIMEIEYLSNEKKLERMLAYTRALVKLYGIHGKWKEEKGRKIPPTISIGAQSFEKLRTKGCFLIDKTAFISEWWEQQDEATLIIRPRRFGKTLTLDMLRCFFSNSYAERGDLFLELKIWENKRYRELQGSYPVIYLSFANVKGSSYDHIRGGVVHTLVELYREHGYLRDSDALDEKDRMFWDLVTLEMADDIVIMAIHNLSAYLCQYYQKRVLIFLDEYDTPLQDAYLSGCWEELSDLFRSIFQSAFKTNPYMERALMTGTSRVSKESLFSDMNHLCVVTTSSKKYADMFGFTGEEVQKMLKAYGRERELSKVASWYDGFIFGGKEHMYNPWSITCLLSQEDYKPYWANTSSNRLVGTLLKTCSKEVKQALEDLLAGGTIQTPIDEEIVFSQLDRSEEAVWGFLVVAGYLRIEATNQNSFGDTHCTLRLTNLEARLVLHSQIRSWFTEEKVPYTDFVEAFLQRDLDYMNDYMNEISEKVFSYFDVGSGNSSVAHPERFYHGFVLGLIVELEGRYRITSNRESGLGRYDVMMEPLREEDYAYILEFKVHNPRREKALEDTLAAAHAQLADRGYAQELEAKGIAPERICSYGFAFQGKHALIG